MCDPLPTSLAFCSEYEAATVTATGFQLGVCGVFTTPLTHLEVTPGSSFGKYCVDLLFSIYLHYVLKNVPVERDTK
jgi:hypothetical protein